MNEAPVARLPAGSQHPSRTAARRQRIGLIVLPCAVLLAYLLYPCRQYHWDSLERAYLLEHPGRYLHTWDGSPRSLFVSFAHVLELPLAAILRPMLGGASGLQTLCVFEALLAALTVFVLGGLVRDWRHRIGRQAGTLRAAVLAQSALAIALAFWKMGSSGEERVLALATQLLFLAAFWNAFESDTPASARSQNGPRAWDARCSWVAATLALAILSHLTGAVLVPFAVLALWLLPGAWRPRRTTVARAVGLGSLVAGLVYVAVAAWTVDARTPPDFIRYVTFFHRAAGNDFWEPSGAAPSGPHRLVRIATGIGSFFTGESWAGVVTLLALAGFIAWTIVRARRTDRSGTPALAKTGIRTLGVHSLLLAGLWCLHFAFFEPQNFESWTLVAALLVLVAAVGLPGGKAAWAAVGLPLLLFTANLRHYAANHQPLELEAYRRVLERDTRPGDIVVLVGGIQNQKPLRGSISMRFYLATLRNRTLASLYDILGVTQREFWDRPFASPAALQAALDRGAHAYMPRFLQPDLERVNASGIASITTAARGDSLLEILHIESR